MLLIVLGPVEAHAPDHLQPVLHQHLDECKLVKVQQVYQVSFYLRVWLGTLHHDTYQSVFCIMEQCH